MGRVVLASNNEGKARELGKRLDGLGIELIAQSFYYVPQIDETGLSFVENAILKARNACAHTSLPAIADDSGLEVDGLDGEPGIYSARYAGEGATDADNNRRLLDELIDVSEEWRSARFHCALVYLRHAGDPRPVIAEGTWEGRIVDTPRGGGGFGYDPLFYVPSQDCTVAQLDPATKHRLSHRGQALATLIERLRRSR